MKSQLQVSIFNNILVKRILARKVGSKDYYYEKSVEWNIFYGADKIIKISIFSCTEFLWMINHLNNERV